MSESHLTPYELATEERRAMDAVYCQNVTNSPLLSLPGEVRDRIYSHLWHEEEKIVPSPPHTFGFLAHPQNRLAMPMTCRQLQYEIAHLPFTVSTLVGNYRTLDFALTYMLTPAQADFIPTVELEVAYSWLPQTAQIARSLTSILGCLCELRDLRTLILFPNTQLISTRSWNNFSQHVLAAVEEVFDHIPASAKIEVVVASWEDVRSRAYVP
ncbi:hypothetical protein Ptr902_09492 [Pyrenophora tritici-repentis]|nr:hypothetical protein Ptr902_09492 [Pyrenophora tritici-repentis]